MPISDQTRADLRARLKRHTDNKLTLAADQDTYLNEAELDVFTEWRKFDPGLFRPARDSVATSASGVLLLDADFSRLEYLQSGSNEEYREIKDMSQVHRGTGFYFTGFDQSANQRQLIVIRNGNPVASTTLYWFNIKQMLMGVGDTVKSALPNEHRKLITFCAAFLYYRDKGTAFIQSKEDWKRDYREALMQAESWYKNTSKSPEYVTSVDPDAGGGGRFASVTQTL